MTSIPTIPEKLLKLKDIIEPTLTSFIKVTTHLSSSFSELDSKLGDVPYWPQNLPLIDINGQSPKLFAQINFSKLTEQGITLPHYPQSGILQFFIAEGDDMWGLQFNDNNGINTDLSKSNAFKVIYHPDVTQISIYENDLISVSSNNSYMPFEKPLLLNFELSQEYLSLTDAYMSNKIYNFSERDDDEIMESFYNDLNNAGSKIGGYAYFTQEDPRSYSTEFNPKDEWVLLLQLDSDDNMMFGDVGVANWFIKKQDLIDKNFENVFFSWDCC